MEKKKQRNTIITDWLEEYGDPEIDKKVEERLEQITKEILSEKKQSSVEWLVQQLKPAITLQEKYINEFLEQAKAMHKEEIEHAYQKGRFNGQTNWGYGNDITAEQYYNETFNNENTDTTT